MNYQFSDISGLLGLFAYSNGAMQASPGYNTPSNGVDFNLLNVESLAGTLTAIFENEAVGASGVSGAQTINYNAFLSVYDYASFIATPPIVGTNIFKSATTNGFQTEVAGLAYVRPTTLNRVGGAVQNVTFALPLVKVDTTAITAGEKLRILFLLSYPSTFTTISMLPNSAANVGIASSIYFADCTWNSSTSIAITNWGVFSP